MISFRQMDHTKALDQKIKEKSEKLLKYLGQSAIIQWTCSVSKNTHQSIVKIHDGSHNYYVRAEAHNIYKTFDEAIKKLKQQFMHTRRYASIHIK